MALSLMLISRLYHKGKWKTSEFLKQEKDLTRFALQKDHSSFLVKVNVKLKNQEIKVQTGY